MNVSDEIVVRGCEHTFQEGFWERLLNILGELHTLLIHCLGDPAEALVTAWVQYFALIQRCRHLVGHRRAVEAGRHVDDYLSGGTCHFKLFIIICDLGEKESQDLEQRWATRVPKSFTGDTKLVIQRPAPVTLPDRSVGLPRSKTVSDVERQLFTESSPPSSRAVSDSSVVTTASDDSGVVIDDTDAIKRWASKEGRSLDALSNAAATLIQEDCGCRGWCNEANDCCYLGFPRPSEYLATVFTGVDPLLQGLPTLEDPDQEEKLDREEDLLCELRRSLW